MLALWAPNNFAGHIVYPSRLQPMGMANDKVQMSNEIQSSNVKATYENLHFDIPLILGF
jgi:hypothetical protein